MASLRKISGSWVIDWRDAAGRHRQTIGGLQIISAAEAKHQLWLKERELAIGGASVTPITAAFAREYMLWHQAEHPSSTYRIQQIIEGHLIPAFGTLALDAIRPRLVEDYKQRRGQIVAPATVAKEVRTLKAMLERAVAWEVMPVNYIARVAEPKSLLSRPVEFYTVEQLRALYAASEYSAVWRLYANTGMRRGEGLQLKRQNVGRESIRIVSSEEARTKSGKWREIPITDGAREALERLGGDDYVLPRIRPESLSRACIRDASRAQIGGSIHVLRHTYISHLVMAGVPIRTVQILAGHSTIAVTERYAHLAPGHLQDAGRAISL